MSTPKTKTKRPRCPAVKKNGEQCKQVAGWGTDHLGEGKCRKHGGNAGRKPKHGIYSKRLKHKLGDLIAQFEEDNPLDMVHELAACRALFVDFIDRYEETTEALLAWHASFSDAYQAAERKPAAAGERQPNLADFPTKPRRITDIADGHKLLAEASRIIKRIEDIKAQNAVSIQDLTRIMQEMGRVVERHVDDESTLERIRDGWLTVRL
jgi:hypothetical protein